MSATSERARLTVQDHATGITSESEQRIFESFEQVESEPNFGDFCWAGESSARSSRRTVARSCVEPTRRRFDVHRRAAAPADVCAVPQRERLAWPRGTLLLVDDYPLLRHAFIDLRQEEAHFVHTAADGAKALKLLYDGLSAGVILLDLMMPGMDGLTFRARQLQDPLRTNIPVIIVSATDDVVR